ncbi:methyl-accepting chemotaxis protein [Larsenimonas rhizosphaerae]|uniref:methyl-accepting chemotaxis protein n=1 Tax=Larsenimonas rhizosphaerae TaxID=2944682 RepID=UPI002033A0C2|nr:methyl-accepting chemotaxis protein [Larsenimonas rhizosphaerae]MCM2131892.1 methyl-accepting chemotaxis protein [Larsenimonas rhizosphaerae]
MAIQFNSLKTKYMAAFMGVAIALLITLLLAELTISSTRDRMVEFSGTFNRAVSAVLNADRDLYQAHVAELNYLSLPSESKAAADAKADYEENAQQAFDRMKLYQSSLAAYPALVERVSDFEQHYALWKQQSSQVFALKAAGDTAAATALSQGQSLDAFSRLRDVYDTAGEAADQKIDQLGAETLGDISNRMIMLWIVSGSAFIFSVVVALMGPTLLTRNIKKLINRIHDISNGEGDLTRRLDASRQDELGDLARAFNEFVEHIDETLSGVQHSTANVRGSANEIAGSSREMASRTEKTAANLEQTTASMEDMTQAVNKTSDAAREASRLSEQTAELARDGQQAMTAVEASMDNISTSAGKVSDIITLIDSIAFQTNLLALNASVEAARAGEHGRGFAVVAQEVRTLAGRAGDAAQNIRDLIMTSAEHTENGTRMVIQASETMTRILEGVEQVNTTINRISGESQGQSDGIRQISLAINELDQITQQNAAMVEESSAAADDLREQTSHLYQMISGFKLSKQAPTVAETSSHPAPSTAPAPAPAPKKAPAPVKPLAQKTATPPRRTVPDTVSEDDWTEF